MNNEARAFVQERFVAAQMRRLGGDVAGGQVLEVGAVSQHDRRPAMPEDAVLRGIRSEINIAPLVDVTMVLLIIFMAAAPLLQAGYDVSLPRPAAGPSAEPTTVALDRAGGLRLNGKAVERKDLEAQLSVILASRSDRLVLFDAEDDATYADAVDVLDVIRRAGGRIGVGFGEPPDTRLTPSRLSG